MIELACVTQFALLHDYEVRAVVHDGRVGVRKTQHTRHSAVVTRFLAQLTHARLHRVAFVRIHHAAGDFQFHRVRAVTILLHHHQFIVRREREHVDPIHRFNDEEVVGLARARGNLFVGTNFEDAELADIF